MDSVVVIGNGPSLKGFDFKSLDKVHTIGMNAAYRYWDKIDWYPTHYICMDDKVTQTHYASIKRLIDEGRIKRFFLTRFMLDYYPELKHDARIIFLEQVNSKYEKHAEQYCLNSIESKYFFSEFPMKITTGGASVRFACYLGYRRVTMLGIDLEYKELDGVLQKEEGIGLKVVKEIKKNPNYFFDDYQSVGDAFNIPNPVASGDLHFNVFKILADDKRKRMWPVSIFNSNKFSKIYQNNTFPYVPLDSFIQAADKEKCFNLDNVDNLRVLVLDPTHIGHQSATGQIKELFFSDFKNDNVAQITVSFDDLKISVSTGLDLIRNGEFEAVSNVDEAIDFIKDFSPDVIYFRPINSKKIFELALFSKKQLGIRLVTHFMDDWVLRYKKQNLNDFYDWEFIIQDTINVSDEVVAISNKMAKAYQLRYGKKWSVLANGIEVNKSTLKQVNKSNSTDKFIIRYMGGAADDMNFQSLVDFAWSIESHPALKEKVEFQIYTMPWYIHKLKDKLGKFKSCTVSHLVDTEEYFNVLTTSDALLIAYNFDLETERYVALSMANKLPECISAGTNLIAFGPSTIATIENVLENGLGIAIVERNVSVIQTQLLQLTSRNPINEVRVLRAKSFAYHFLNSALVKDQFKKLVLNSISLEKSDHVVTGLSKQISCIEKTLVKEEITFKFGNDCFRDQQYLKAIVIYLTLFAKKKSNSLGNPIDENILFNSILAFNKIGFESADIFSVLTRFK